MNMNGKMLTIKETAELLKISEHKIRYYTDQGMIPNMKRGENNYRLFDEEALDWLRGTVYFRELGFSLKDIRHFHDLCLCEDPDALWERYEIILKYYNRSLQMLQEAKERVSYMEKSLEKAKKVAEHKLEDAKNPRLKKYPESGKE